jgi:hypothetical protein
MSLHPETERLIREFFGGQTCCKCGRSAVRFCQNQFYCHDHNRTARPKRGGRLRVHKQSA